MQEAKEAAKRKIKQMELDKREAARRTSATKSSYSGSYAPITASSIGAGSGGRMSMGIGAGAEGADFGHARSPASPTHPHSQAPIQTTIRAGKGMKIGRRTATID